MGEITPQTFWKSEHKQLVDSWIRWGVAQIDTTGQVTVTDLMYQFMIDKALAQYLHEQIYRIYFMVS